ncbi:riboflavin synthase, alpha subunit [Tremella mesenterica]|uniref:Riboflavin synthase n=1 Tax=Tremella mesenterica TaxID=5217 RepID=A0A4V1M451_TREME|nr:uncharacterized protein TREMEDRAFT_67284 [Tremella mesenterica DSM 1558]EIW73250.1 hypothetical protein TREMEDRAFT_67284 [Tremella mesenterica DSM 1558]RXK39147.1 riboflavin synthase, alpha subunit [Tremella mesenterica]
MFTGIIEITARISSITPSSSSSGFTLTLDEAHEILVDCHVGDSICVNGACLTVTEFDMGAGWFKVGLAHETLQRTNLGQLQIDDRVNCERAMSSHTRFGGHMVQGHIDSTAKIISIIPDGNSLRFKFEFPPQTNLMPYLVEKGYITIDGASLTLVFVDDSSLTFGIMLISHSQEILTLSKKKVGESVNVEVDILGKYILGGTGRMERLIDNIVEKRMKEKGII